MAEIHIQRKQRSAVPWLLSGLLFLVLAWYLFAQNTQQRVASAIRADSSYRVADTVAPAAAVPAMPNLNVDATSNSPQHNGEPD